MKGINRRNAYDLTEYNKYPYRMFVLTQILFAFMSITVVLKDSQPYILEKYGSQNRFFCWAEAEIYNAFATHGSDQLSDFLSAIYLFLFGVFNSFEKKFLNFPHSWKQD